ncbi:MAG: FkbM family methyltransferase [Bacteroidetes bacterium]|nr:FkbM family methyltransferase [Bacteroidota bacterium]
MSNLIANIVKGIIGKFKPKAQVGRFKDISWTLEKILKHEEDQTKKQKKLPIGLVNYIRPYELLHTYRELFGKEMYLFEAANDTPIILDCGSNIGLSVLYFKTIYPKAKVWAFEPDPTNFELLNSNIQSNNLQDVIAKPSAVWITDGKISFSGNGSEASRIDESNSSTSNNDVNCFRLKTLLQSFDRIDFLKMDIEGGEYKVITDCADILHRVEHLFLEYHGKTTDTQQLTELLDIVHRQGFQAYIRNAADALVHPFVEKQTNTQFDVQLNIFCYKK